MKLLERFRDKKVYHFSDFDLDGIGARVIGEYYIKPITLEYYTTNSAKRDMSEWDDSYAEKSDTIIFTDITPTIELLRKLQEQGKDIIIFDHHVSGYEVIRNDMPNEDYYYTTEKCGTKIFFDELTKGLRVKKILFQFVELVDIYDRHVDESSLWKKSASVHHALMESICWWDKNNVDKGLKFIETQLEKFNKGRNFYLTGYEETLVLKGEKKVRTNYTQAVKTMKKRVDNSGNKYAYLECNSKISFVVNKLLKEHTDIDYLVCHSVYEDNQGNPNGKVSLRSAKNTGMDVSTIAEVYGGGGHRNASGIELELDIFRKVQAGTLHLI